MTQHQRTPCPSASLLGLLECEATIDELINHQRIALQAGKCEEALSLLDSIVDEIDRANAWAWLQKHEPESHEQLIRKVGHARVGLAQSGRSELSQLERVFTRCKDHGIELSTLDLPRQLAIYRESTGKLNAIVINGAEESQVEQELLAAIQMIKSHRTGAETRKWAMTPRKTPDTMAP